MVKGEKQIRVNCLGRLEIYVDNKEQSMTINSGKIRELIAFLMTYKGAPVSKATVCEALWEEVPIEYSKDCLYKLLKRIRNLSLPFHIESTRGMLRLDIDNIESDIFQLDELSAKRYDINESEKLVNLFLSKGSLFEEEGYGWINMKSAAYDKNYIDSICRLKDYYEETKEEAKRTFYKKLADEFA